MSTPMAHIANCLEMDQEDLTIGLNNYIAAKTVTEESIEPVCNHLCPVSLLLVKAHHFVAVR